MLKLAWDVYDRIRRKWRIVKPKPFRRLRGIFFEQEQLLGRKLPSRGLVIEELVQLVGGLGRLVIGRLVQLVGRWVRRLVFFPS